MTGKASDLPLLENAFATEDALLICGGRSWRNNWGEREREREERVKRERQRGWGEVDDDARSACG
jgi:hypothetical protein